MKSRISFFNKAVIRKDVTRFAPLWAIYLIGGLLVMLTALSGRSNYYSALNLAETIGPFSIINLIYAALCAQSLFADLFQTRLCNALHALPMRRETWFASHVLSGLLFSLVPHVIGTVMMAALLRSFWYVGLIWLLGMVLEYLFFFGIAVFSVFCTGNRVAMAAVYGILNFASMIAYWFVTTIYEPLLYGVSIPTEQFQLFSPVVQMCKYSDLVKFTSQHDGFILFEGYTGFTAGLGEGWWYLAVCAVLGVALLGAALALYRRRKLECAGDFIAVKPMEPIFAVVFTVCVGCVFALVEQMFADDYMLFLCVGLVIGWFVGQMLLQRTVKVFKGKSFVKLAILLLAFGASILLTWLDPIGTTRWVPEAKKVSVVEIDTGSRISINDNQYLRLTEQADIEKIIEAHGQILESRSNTGRRTTMTICYTMKDGRKVTRTYDVRMNTKQWSLLEAIYNTPERVLGYTDWETFVGGTDLIWEGEMLLDLCRTYAKYAQEKVDYLELHDTMRRSLLEALRKDCEEGLLPQTMVSGSFTYKFWVELSRANGAFTKYRNISVYDESYNTMAWVREYKDILTFVAPEKYD